MKTTNHLEDTPRRRDWHTRSVVNAGVDLSNAGGVSTAADFLRSKRIPLSIALRVLSHRRPAGPEALFEAGNFSSRHGH